jgi:hypothetical protein
MVGNKKFLFLVAVLVLTGSIQAFSQQFGKPDSGQLKVKPFVHYTVGSSVTFIPHYGTFTGFTVSPTISVPLNPKLTVEGGLIAGNYFSSFRGFGTEGRMNGSFTSVSLFGSALYHVSPRFMVYGSGLKQLYSNSPYSYFPRNYYTVGTTYNFGNFSIGASLQMSTWDNNFMPMNSPNRLYMPY